MPENEENNVEWEPPPPPSIKNEPREEPQMSEVATLGNIYFEPENTFRDLRRKPRFVIAGIILALLVTAFTFGLAMKVGDEGMRSFISDQYDKNPTTQNLDKDTKQRGIDMQMKISTYTRFAVPVFVIISFLIGALLYWLGGKAFGGTGTFGGNLSVWVYSSFAPGVIAMIANFIVLMFKSADDIDLAASQRGVIHANLGFFVGKEHPFIGTFLNTFDLFAIWGWILAAIGLSVINKMSKASAWTLILIIVIIGLAFRMIGTYFSGNAS
jgi:hypothetical protein